MDLTTLRADYYHAFDLLGVAENALANRCMINLGFEPLPLALPPEQITQRDYIGELGRLGLTESGASIDGYEDAPLSQEQARVDPREELQRNLDRAIYNENWFEAWQGAADPLSELPQPDSDIPTDEQLGGVGGCVGEAQAQIRQNYDAQGLVSALRSTEQLWGDVFSRTDTNEEYLAALSLWSDCMREAGFNYSELIEAYGAAQQNKANDPESVAAQAVADARCQTESKVISVYDVAWTENQAIVQNSNEALSLLAWHQANFDLALDQILIVLEESGLPVERE